MRANARIECELNDVISSSTKIHNIEINISALFSTNKQSIDLKKQRTTKYKIVIIEQKEEIIERSLKRNVNHYVIQQVI